jgi:toxin ParE1/3/4
LEDFEILFQRLVLNPELGKERKEIRAHLRSFPKGEHVVFYRIMENYIRIVRVLHGSRDLGKNF